MRHNPLDRPPEYVVLLESPSHTGSLEMIGRKK